MSDRRWPVSVKGVVTASGHVLLLRNERQEWELPGGRLEAGETPEHAVEREVLEETGLVVTVAAIVDAWVHPVLPEREVLIVTYRCGELDGMPDVALSDEHREARWFPLDDLPGDTLPAGYRRSILAACAGRPAPPGRQPGG